MRLIDADAIPWCNYDLDNYHCFVGVDKEYVDELPTIDAVPVVRCKDCKSSRELNEKERMCVCSNALICKNSEAHVDGWNPVWPDDFCSYGERKEADGNG